MENEKKRKDCVNYTGWLCDEVSCDGCRSYMTEWGEDEIKFGQLKIDYGQGD